MTLNRQISYNKWFCSFEDTKIVSGLSGINRWEYEILDGCLCEVCSHPVENSDFTGKRCNMCFGKNDDIFRFKKIYALGAYQKSHPTTLMTHIWANKSHTLLAPILGMSLALLMEHKYPVLKEADVLIPVPCYKDELNSKGFNHAEELAKIVSHFMKIPCNADVLTKTKDEKMKGGTWEERHERAAGMYKAKNKISGNVILIDDLVTTQATSSGCAFQLLEAGAESIDVLTVARNIYEEEQQ